MSGWLRADRIQGSVSPGFAKDEQAFLWLRFPSADSARAWLKETVPQLTSAGEVLAFRALRAQLLAQSGSVDIRSTWVNVAFSRAGLDLLVPAPAGTFPEPFEQGMAARAALLGDTPSAWRFGGTPDTEAHALVIIAADTEADLLQALDVHRERLARHVARDIFLEILGADCRGAKLPGELRGHEHFGYRDGISEPAVDGSPGTGDFVLGYPDSAGVVSSSGPAWTRDGSYLVFRRLHQDVAGFHQALDVLTKNAGLNRFVWDMRYPDATTFPGLIMWAGSVRGAQAPPGQYQVRLTAGGQTKTEPFSIVRNPRISSSDADLQQQFTLARDISAKVSATNEAVVKIRTVKEQIAERSTKAKDAKIKAASEALATKLTDVEGLLYQYKNRSNQDPLNFPIRLNNKLAALQGIVESGDYRPTDQSYAVFKELTSQLETHLGRLDVLLKSDVDAFNKLIARKKLPPVVAK